MLPPDVTVEDRTINYTGLVNSGTYSHTVHLHCHKPHQAKEIAKLLDEALSGVEVRQERHGKRQSRTIAIQDDQLNIIKIALDFLLEDLRETGATHILTEKQMEEAKLLSGCCASTVKEPLNSDILHGFCL